MNFPISGWRSFEVDATPVRAGVVLRDAQQGEDGRWRRPDEECVKLFIKKLR